MPAADPVTQQPPVIILGTGITGLGVMRIVARDGLSGFVGEASDPLLRDSRWYRQLPGPNGSVDERSLESWLPGLSIGRAVLIPCSDQWVSRVAALDATLRERFPASVPSTDTLERFVDKGRFAELLREAGTPHPFSRILLSESDLATVPDHVFLGAILKPRDSQRFFQRFKVKAFHVHSREDAVAQLTTLIAEGFPVILQEYIPGPATQHYFIDGFVDRNGTVQAVFARQRLRMYPLDFGNSTAMVSVPLDEASEAVASITTLLGLAKYRGMFSAEFKRDLRDGVFKLLEVNTRAWWYVDFAARCGVDVVKMAYDDALGRDVQRIDSYAVGRKLVFPYPDFYACLHLWRHGELTIGGWIGSWLGAMQPVFQLNDPTPGLRSFAKTMRSFVGTRIRRLLPAAAVTHLA